MNRSDPIAKYNQSGCRTTLIHGLSEDRTPGRFWPRGFFGVVSTEKSVKKFICKI